MTPYIFLIATVIAVFPILVIFKVTVERIKENPEKLQKRFMQFFIFVALFEAIPIVLIVYGLSQATSVQSIEQLYMPGILILLIISIAALFIFLQWRVGTDQELKSTIAQFAFIAFALTISIPIISFVGLLMMLP